MEDLELWHELFENRVKPRFEKVRPQHRWKKIGMSRLGRRRVLYMVPVMMRRHRILAAASELFWPLRLAATTAAVCALAQHHAPSQRVAISAAFKEAPCSCSGRCQQRERSRRLSFASRPPAG